MVWVLTDKASRISWISFKRRQLRLLLFLLPALTLGLLLLRRFLDCSTEEVITSDSSDENIASKRLNIVAQFPVITTGSGLGVKGILRQEEYLEVLIKNLLHPQVEHIHLLLENDHDQVFLQSLKLKRHDKLVFYKLSRRMRYGDAMRYVSNFLINRTVVIINADCFIGHGFNQLDPVILQQDTIYALTRHETRHAVKNCDVRDLCSPLTKYIGSHDAFVMHLNKPLPNDLIEKLMVRPDIVGAEKFVIFLLRTMGGFQVKNPCSILHIYHNHCSKIRHTKLIRFINGKRLNKFYIPNVPPWTMTAPISGL